MTTPFIPQGQSYTLSVGNVAAQVSVSTIGTNWLMIDNTGEKPAFVNIYDETIYNDDSTLDPVPNNFSYPTEGNPGDGIVIQPGQSKILGSNGGASHPSAIWVAGITASDTTVIYITPGTIGK